MTLGIIIILVSVLILCLQLEVIRLHRYLATEIVASTSGAGVPASGFSTQSLAYFQKAGQKIISKEDWDFVCKRSEKARSLFLIQRKNLALQWLSEGECRVVSLISVHRKAMRMNAELVPWQEVCCFGYYIFFRAFTLGAKVVTLICGPFALRRFVNGIMLVCGKIGPGVAEFEPLAEA